MAHNVKCAICGKSFDRDKIQAVHYGARRYAHLTCCPDGELAEAPLPPKEKEEKKENDDGYTELKDYISELFGKKANWPLIAKQIKNYHEDLGYSYTGIKKSLFYAYKVKKNDISKAKGIGVTPICYQDAYNYFYSIWLANEQNKKKVEPLMWAMDNQEDIVIKISNPKRDIKKRKLFNFLDEEKKD